MSELRELRQLREENKKLKHLVADLSLEKHMLPEVLANKALRPACKRELVRFLQERFEVSERRACGLPGRAIATRASDRMFRCFECGCGSSRHHAGSLDTGAYVFFCAARGGR